MYRQYPSAFTTYEQVNTRLKSNASEGDLTNDKTLIESYIKVASEQVRQFCNRTFVPYINASALAPYANYSRFCVLQLPDDMQVLTSIADVGGNVIDSSYYRLRDVNNQPNGYPWAYVEIDSQAITDWFSPNNNLSPVFTVNGVYGFGLGSYETNYTLGSTLAIAITDSQTTFSVVSASLFETLQTIRIESEFMTVTAFDTNANTITVTRGVNGSTAVAHDGSGTPLNIDIWQPPHMVQDATARITAFLYASRQSIGNTIVFQDGTTASQYPNQAYAQLMQYRKPVFLSV